MSTWNYRYVYDTQRKRLLVAEVYYDDLGSPVLCTSDPIELEGFDYTDDDCFDNKVEDIKLLLNTINKDLKKNPDILFYPDSFVGEVNEY